VTLALAVVLLGAAAACSESPGPPHGARANRDTGRKASAYPTRWPIKHVIFIIKENRSFDQYFGLFPGADGATTGKTKTGVIPLHRGIPDKLQHDLLHGYTTALSSYDHGKMDGFAWDQWSRKYAYSEALPSDIPNYWHWAKQFVLADKFFASAQGPSFPNHLFTIAAQSGGTHENPKRLGMHGAQWTWGCDAPSFTNVQVYDSEGHTEWVPPCFDFLTEGDLLRRAGIPWAYYAATIRQAGYIWSAYDAVAHVRQSPQWKRYIHPVDLLLRDIVSDRLPPVTWVTPRFELSEHPEYSLCHGQNWTTKVVNAVMESPMWRDTAIFITWDDWGGFYDHVPPRQVDPFGFGFRVPMLLISPFAKRGHIDSRVGEFSSVLRFIENNWSLTQLTHRDRAARDLTDDFDFSSPPRPPDPRPLRTDCKGPALTLPPRLGRG
jgi:phospholipase C